MPRWLPLGVAAGLFLLAGCGPPDKVGVRFESAGEPVVTNCGTWISGIRVSDADTGRVIWEASAVPAHNGGLQTVDHVRLGELPGAGWQEVQPVVTSPGPATWRFEIDSINDTTIDVPASAVTTDRVF